MIQKKTKSEQEVRNEIEATIDTINNYQEAYRENKIPFCAFEKKVRECHVIISTLKWVLGDNDRYD